MGSVGKTTIARAVYEAIQDEFKFNCFVRNVCGGLTALCCSSVLFEFSRSRIQKDHMSDSCLLSKLCTRVTPVFVEYQDVLEYLEDKLLNYINVEETWH